MEMTRDKVQNWLMSEGWRIAEQAHPDMEWLIRAEDAAERRILVGQDKTRPDCIHLEALVTLSRTNTGGNLRSFPKIEYGKFPGGSVFVSC